MIYKNSDEVQNNSYINKDFQALWEELLELIPKFTNKWDPQSANESDPLAVLLKVLAIYSDKLNYNIDKSILERFPQTLTELRSAKNVYEALGYNAPWYKAASTDLTFTYIKKIVDELSDSDTNEFYIPRFTEFSDEDKEIVFTLTDSTELKFDVQDYKLSSPNRVQSRQALQGKIHKYEINGLDKITTDNLDSNNRLYFTEPNVAYNGIFIDTDPNFKTDSKWVRVDNIYQSIDSENSHPYQFGVDPVSGACYIEFADTIANSIQSGLYIMYITTNGEDGNAKARSINTYFDENNYAVNQNLIYNNVSTVANSTTFVFSGVSVSNINLDGIINVINTYAVQNGTDPATIDEMYKNYKRVKNTFDTLVTVLDYENYLYRYEKKDGTNVVSNIRVSDRTNDLLDSYRVWTMDTRQEILRTKVVPQSIEDNTPSMTSSIVKFYPLNPIPNRGVASKIESNGVVDNLDFKYTFSNSSFWEDRKQKKVNKDTFGVPNIINKESEDLMNIVEDTKTMTTDIYQYPCDLIFIPYNLVGQIYLNNKVSKQLANEVKINVDKALYEALNSRELDFGKEISYINVLNIIKNADDRISYVALNPIEYLNAELPELKYVSGTTATTDDEKKEVVTQKAMLNGNTPWAPFEEDFIFKANQENGDIDSFSAPITIKSEVALSSLTSSKYKVEQNEDLIAFAPQYQDIKLYSNYLFYYCNFSKSKNTPYELQQGEWIKFYQKRPTSPNDEPKYIIKEGQTIRATFDLSDNTSSSAGTLDTEKTIAEIGYVQGNLSDSPTTMINWVTNSQDLIDRLSTSASWSGDSETGAPTNDAYTLKSGEYFLFYTEGENTLTLLGEGNTIASSQAIDITVDTFKWFNADWESLLNGYDLASVNWQGTLGSIIYYRQNQIYIFSEGYIFEYSSTPQFSNWEGDGTEFIINTTNLTYYQEGDESNPQSLPALLSGDNWKGLIRLSYTLGDVGFTLGSFNDSDFVSHVQKLSVNEEEYENITIQSNMNIESPGGIDLNLSEDYLKAYFPNESSPELKIYNYNISQALTTTTNFTKLPASWTVPGPSGYYAVFGAYTNDTEGTSLGSESFQDLKSSTVYYFMAKCGEDISVSGEIWVTLIKVLPSDSTYSWANIPIQDNVIIRLDKESLGDEEFNPTHDITKQLLIKDPTAPESYFNRNHPMNRYVMPKLESVENLVINQYSIES